MRERVVSALRRVARRLLPLAATRRERSRGAGPASRGRDHAALYGAPRTVREPAAAPPPPGRWLGGESPARRSIDARPGAARQGGARLPTEGAAPSAVRAAPEPALDHHGRAPEPGLGWRHHLPARGNGLALSRRGDGPVLAARARLDAHAAAHRGRDVRRPHA